MCVCLQRNPWNLMSYHAIIKKTFYLWFCFKKTWYFENSWFTHKPRKFVTKRISFYSHLKRIALLQTIHHTLFFSSIKLPLLNVQVWMLIQINTCTLWCLLHGYRSSWDFFLSLASEFITLKFMMRCDTICNTNALKEINLKNYK